MKDPVAVANVQRADASGCILAEDRSFMRESNRNSVHSINALLIARCAIVMV